LSQQLAQAQRRAHLGIGEVMDDLARRPPTRGPAVEIRVGDVRQRGNHRRVAGLVPLDEGTASPFLYQFQCRWAAPGHQNRCPSILGRESAPYLAAARLTAIRNTINRTMSSS